MSDFSYRLIRAIGYPVFWITARPVVLHVDRARRDGAYILAANHLSPYDIPGLMATTPRNLDFLSIVEMLKNPFVARFFRMMNCTFVDRRRADPSAAQGLSSRLRRGRVVAMFPEAGIRTMETSVIHGGSFKPGCIRLAQLTGAPVIPCVIVGTSIYSKFSSWYPFRAVRFGVNYGEAINVAPNDDVKIKTEMLRMAYLDLYRELRQAMPSKEPRTK
jgi:1-acyl-sn-glycerol-3-phosphate acyltransferase